MIANFVCTELCKNIPAKFRESPSKYSAAHPKNALWRNISAIHSRNLEGIILHYSVSYLGIIYIVFQLKAFDLTQYFRRHKFTIIHDRFLLDMLKILDLFFADIYSLAQMCK